MDGPTAPLTGDGVMDGVRRPSESAVMLAGLWLMATAGTSYRCATHRQRTELTALTA